MCMVVKEGLLTSLASEHSIMAGIFPMVLIMRSFLLDNIVIPSIPFHIFTPIYIVP